MKTGRNEGRKEKKIDEDRKVGAGHAGTSRGRGRRENQDIVYSCLKLQRINDLKKKRY